MTRSLRILVVDDDKVAFMDVMLLGKLEALAA